MIVGTALINTIKTTIGFVVSAIEKYTPLKLTGNTLEDTYNYVKISDLVATSGQPNEDQFRMIKASGYTTVINLAPKNVLENSLKTESSLLTEMGVAYIHIPVKFENPTEDDFQQFVSAMTARSNEKVWVHCAANARVSAFMYRYRKTVLGESEQAARHDLDKIWTPLGVWKQFIQKGQ